MTKYVNVFNLYRVPHQKGLNATENGLLVLDSFADTNKLKS